MEYQRLLAVLLVAALAAVLLAAGCAPKSQFQTIPDDLPYLVFIGKSRHADKNVAIAEAQTEAMSRAYKHISLTGSIENLKPYLLALNMNPTAEHNLVSPVEASFLTRMRRQLRKQVDYTDTITRQDGDSTYYVSQFVLKFDTAELVWLSAYLSEEYEKVTHYQEMASESMRRDDFVGALRYMGKRYSLTSEILGMLGDKAGDYHDFSAARSGAREVIVDLLSRMELVPPVRRIFYTGDSVLDEVITLTLNSLSGSRKTPVRQAELAVTMDSMTEERVMLLNPGKVPVTDSAGKAQLQVRSIARSEKNLELNVHLAVEALPEEFNKYLPAATVEFIDERHSTEQVDPVRMVYIDGGVFEFGGSKSDPDRQDDELPRVRVEVEPFLIDIHEVTNRQYRNFLESTGYRQEPRYLHVSDLSDPDKPVVGVSWEDAKAYADWVGKRLPTEAEFQLAAQGPERRRYPWGDEFVGTVCTYSANTVTTSPVSRHEGGKSPYGIYDLAGNVWEWCADWYDVDLMDLQEDGGPYRSPSMGGLRSVRGGSWKSDRADLRVANRLGLPATTRTDVVGFRCVKDAQ